VAFLIGFLSQTKPDQGYVHFAGIHPDYRSIGIGAFLYEKFYEVCQKYGRNVIKACTSPVNTGSIAFHQSIGFKIAPGNSEMDGTPVTLDYNKPDDPKVLFVTANVIHEKIPEAGIEFLFVGGLDAVVQGAPIGI